MTYVWTNDEVCESEFTYWGVNPPPVLRCSLAKGHQGMHYQIYVSKVWEGGAR